MINYNDLALLDLVNYKFTDDIELKGICLQICRKR